MSIYGDVVNLRLIDDPTVNYGVIALWDTYSGTDVWYWVFLDGTFYGKTQETRLAISFGDSSRHYVDVIAATENETIASVSAYVSNVPAERVELVWSAVSGAASYNIYWNAGLGEPTTLVRRGVIETSYKTEQLASATYKFEVRPVDAAGNEKDSALYAEIEILAYPDAPTGFALTTFNESTSKALFVWN